MCGDVKVQCERFWELMNLYFCHVSLAGYRKRVECRRKNDVKWHKLPCLCHCSARALYIYSKELFKSISGPIFFGSTWVLL